MAQCRLPFYFNILSKLPPGQRPPTKRPRPEPHPRQVYERPPTLTEVNPDSGSTTGGVRIWLRGMDFPALLPLFARFGAAVVPTVRTCPSLSRFISFCLLDLLFFQPSCLSFASHEQPRRHSCYAIEISATKCTGVWDQHRDVQIQRGS